MTQYIETLSNATDYQKNFLFFWARQQKTVAMFALIFFAVFVYWLFQRYWKKRSFKRTSFVDVPKTPFLERWRSVAKEFEDLPQEYEPSVKALQRAMEVLDFKVDQLKRITTDRSLFDAHRHESMKMGGNLGIRLTVQYNLFGGTVANLGSEMQQLKLQEILDKRQLGCFALTEVRGGVLRLMLFAFILYCHV